jgi:hypothetical protein
VLGLVDPMLLDCFVSSSYNPLAVTPHAAWRRQSLYP